MHCGRDHVNAETKLFRGLTQLAAIQMLFLKSYYEKKKYVVDMYDYKKSKTKKQDAVYVVPVEVCFTNKSSYLRPCSEWKAGAKTGNLAEWLFPTKTGKTERLECFMQIIRGNSSYYTSSSLISMSSGESKFRRWTFDVVKVWWRLETVVKTLVVCQNHHLVGGEDIFFLSIILEEKKTVTFNPVCCCSVRLWV